MRSPVVAYSGAPSDIGRCHGEVAAPAVRHNLAGFRALALARGFDPADLSRAAVAREGLVSPRLLEEIEGIARGAQRPYPEVLAYNLYHNILLPDECTVMIAMGDTTANGEVVFFKNSDKVGGTELTGPNFHRFKEINVILAAAPRGGNKFVGPAAAGSVGLKMGLNDKGVATGSNISRTSELARKQVDLTTVRALDRGILMRDGLEHDTAMAAAQAIGNQVLQDPMSTPGNVEFVDSKEALIIEGSYDRMATERVTSGVCARTNMFVLLKELNDWTDVSSQCRYVRCLELLGTHKGTHSPEQMISFSMDHTNGPNLNSICRHGTRPEEEVSLSSMVAEINSKDPGRSRFAIALGKPCHAWREPRGHLWLDMSFNPEGLPRQFVDGEIWKELYIEDPRDA